MKVVAGDRIRSFVWIANLRYMWKCSSESFELDDLLGGSPKSREFIVCPVFMDDVLAPLNGYGFVDGKS